MNCFRTLFAISFLLLSPVNFCLAAIHATGQGELIGRIEEIRFSNPLTGSDYVLAEMDVLDSSDKRWTILINRDTDIRDPQWRSAHLVYLRKGRKIKTDVRSEDNQFIANSVFVQEK